MKKWLDPYLTLSKGEFNGLVILAGCILLLSVAPWFYRRLFPVQLSQGDVRAIIQQLSPPEPMPGERGTAGGMPRAKALQHRRVAKLFPFDPNTLSASGWQQLGFSERQSLSIRKYIEKGGRFYKTEDLKRLYVVSPDAYARLAPYVEINTQQSKASFSKSFSDTMTRAVKWKAKAAVSVDVNLADTLSLLQVKGIGPAFARRIVKYRDRLGGFYRKEQLMEVFGLDSVKFMEIKDQLLVNEAAINRLNINTVDFDGLRKHPYLSYKQINAIIQYRVQHGNYGNFEDLKKVAILSPDVLDKLAPYISF